MRKLHFTFLLCISNFAFTQQTPTGTPQPNVNYNDWFRGGNSGNNLSPNIFGTMWNSPIYTVTNGVNRTRLNGTLTSTIDLYNNLNTSGYIGLGGGVGAALVANYFDNNTPVSQLHLKGGLGNQIQIQGYRPWMKTGMALSDNQDFSYMGLRQVGTGFDVTETTITWADRSGTAGGNFPSGPDDLVFRAVNGGNGNNTISTTDFRDAGDLDGTHVARFTGIGLMGLGNTFGANPTGTPVNLYSRPQSLLHLSFDYRSEALSQPFGYMQITLRRPLTAANDTIGQGEQETDGLRFGIDNKLYGLTGKRHLNGYLRWQEASSFIIQTEDNKTPNIESNERMRITSIGALKLNYTTNQYFGLMDSSNVTRIAISHSGRFPLTKPKSVLHIGYDYGNGFATTEGYRKWMDLGMLVSNSKDHVWLGLQPRDSLETTVTQNYDKNDAVMAWGTDRNVNNIQQVDNMRFVFTGNVLDFSPEISPSNSWHGLEMMRMFPATAYQHYLYNATGGIIDSTTSYGRVGIGDFTWSGVNQQPTQKLDVIGNARLRYLPDSVFIADTLVNKIVMVDSNGVLRWKSFVPSEFGTNCSDTVNGKLNNDKKVVLNNHNLYFTNHPDSMNLNQNRVGIGFNCGDPLPGKLSVFQKHDAGVNQTTTGIYGHNQDSSILAGTIHTGVIGIADGDQYLPKVINRAGYFEASNSQNVFGIQVKIPNSASNTSSARGMEIINSSAANTTIGLDLRTDGFAPYNIGINSRVVNGLNENIAASFMADGTSGFVNIGAGGLAANNSVRNIGGVFRAQCNPTATNIGVVGSAANGSYVPNSSFPSAVGIGVYGTAQLSGVGSLPVYAGYFDGNVFINGPLNGTGFAATTSDAMFKTDVDSLTNALDILQLLKPKTFYFDTTNVYGINFSSELQYGLIAQEVETVLPELVQQNHKPATTDTLGNQVTAAVDYKTLNYSALIPILIRANQELVDSVGSRDSIISAQGAQINDLNDRLSQLENCLSGILPFLCQMSQSAIQANTPQAQEAIRTELTVRLSNQPTIILDQNVPNPFAEQTIINFSIPETVKKAQIHFYDGMGKLLQSVDVVERGLGSITVFGSDLSSGIYTYTLVADGQIVATKKMMKQ